MAHMPLYIYPLGRYLYTHSYRPLFARKLILHVARFRDHCHVQTPKRQRRLACRMVCGAYIPSNSQACLAPRLTSFVRNVCDCIPFTPGFESEIRTANITNCGIEIGHFNAGDDCFFKGRDSSVHWQQKVSNGAKRTHRACPHAFRTTSCAKLRSWNTVVNVEAAFMDLCFKCGAAQYKFDTSSIEP
jgi:hypothetical protein